MTANIFGPLFQHWKEVSIVIAGLSAICSTFWDVKDRQSHKVTAWGRIFLGVTIVTALGALFAQVRDSRIAEEQSLIREGDNRRLLERTEKAVTDISRLLQTLDEPEITLFFDVRCPDEAKFSAFCGSAYFQQDILLNRHKKLVELAARSAQQPDAPAQQTEILDLLKSTEGTTSIPSFDWRKWPGPFFIGPISVNFYRDAENAKKAGSCLGCDSHVDLSFFAMINSKDVSVETQLKPKGRLELMAHLPKAITLSNNGAIVSFSDLKGAAVVVDPGSLAEILELKSILVRNRRGQTITADVRPKKTTAGTLYDGIF